MPTYPKAAALGLSGLRPIAPLPRGAPEGQRFICAKHQHRLWIQDTSTTELLYTHPDFIRLHNRKLMIALAERACARGHLDIEDIVLFECEAPRWGIYRKRGSTRSAFLTLMEKRRSERPAALDPAIE